MPLLLGSSRITRLTRTVSSRALNQPFLPRNQEAVWQGLAGIRRKAKMPTIKVPMPSIRKSQRQPLAPCTPRRWRRPAARRAERMSASDKAVQNQERRIESSWCL
jgi:hypothetical protein